MQQNNLQKHLSFILRITIADTKSSLLNQISKEITIETKYLSLRATSSIIFKRSINTFLTAEAISSNQK